MAVGVYYIDKSEFISNDSFKMGITGRGPCGGHVGTITRNISIGLFLFILFWRA